MSIHWKDWCWSWDSNTLGIWCEELTCWKCPWCWKRLKAGGEGDNGGWDGWMASPTQRTWVWVNSRSWWWTGRPGVLQSMGLRRVRHWTELYLFFRTLFSRAIAYHIDRFSFFIISQNIPEFAMPTCVLCTGSLSWSLRHLQLINFFFLSPMYNTQFVSSKYSHRIARVVHSDRALQI